MILRLTYFILILCSMAITTNTYALDKQGSSHSGSAISEKEGTNLSGTVAWGMSLWNPSYAARPDNTGLVLSRYALHLDADLIGSSFSIPLDINLFTDRKRSGIEKLSPTELDVIGGLTTTTSLDPGAIEVGARIEHDRPVDRGSFTQSYADLRTRWIYSDGKNISGWFTLGWFMYNPTYAARPDNSGLALFRYAAHSQISVWHQHLFLGIDGTFFTDRTTNYIQPSELDLTPELIVRNSPWEFHLAYEHDMMLDRKGNLPSYTQSFIYTLFSWSFDAKALANR